MTRNMPWGWVFRLLWPIAAVGYAVMSAAAYISGPWGELSGADLIIVPVWTLVTVLVALGVAALLYWRAPDNSVALHTSFFLLGWGLLFGGPTETLAQVYPGSPAVAEAIGAVTLALLLPWLLLRFPSGRVEPRWARALVGLVIATALWIVGDDLLRPAIPDAVSGTIVSISEFLTIFPLLLSIWRYRFRATSSERQQMKWVLYGLVAFFILAVLANTAVPHPFGSVLWFVGVMAVPVSFGVAILRYRLWDIDLVIRRTFQYAAITAVLAAVYFGTVVLAQSALVALTGQESPLAVVVSTLSVAALFNPVRRRLQQFVDRAFYRKSYDAEQTLARFGEAVQNEVDIEDVEAALLQAVNETLQPTAVGLWLRSEHN